MTAPDTHWKTLEEAAATDPKAAKYLAAAEPYIKGAAEGKSWLQIDRELERQREDEAIGQIDAAVAAGRTLTYDEFLSLWVNAGDNAGPWLLLVASWRALRPADVTRLVGEVWSTAEFPEHYLRRADWLDLFARAGYTVDGQPAERPAEPVTLYRGCVPSKRRRMAWTADRAQAEWFARRFSKADLPGRVYVTVAPPAALLCKYTERDEDEYVINPRGLKIREVTILEAAA